MSTSPMDLFFNTLKSNAAHAEQLRQGAQQEAQLAEQKRSNMAREAYEGRTADLAALMHADAQRQQDFTDQLALNNAGAQEVGQPFVAPAAGAPAAAPPSAMPVPSAAPVATGLGDQLNDVPAPAASSPAPASPPAAGAMPAPARVPAGAGLQNNLDATTGQAAAPATPASPVNHGFTVTHMGKQYILQSPDDKTKAALANVAAEDAAKYATEVSLTGQKPTPELLKAFPGLDAGTKYRIEDLKAMSQIADQSAQARQRDAAANAPATPANLLHLGSTNDSGTVTDRFLDPTTGEVKKTISTKGIGPTKAVPAAPPGPPSPAAQAAIANPPAAGQRNEAYLAALPAAQQPIVKGLADGTIAWPSGYAQKDPVVMGRVADALRYDPSASAQRFALRNSFTGGKDAANVTSLNTVIGHLGTLDTAADQLDNSAFKGYNTFGNWLSRQAGDPQTAPFRTARRAVASELSTALKGGVASEAEVKGWLDEIDSSDSPKTLHSTIATVGNLIGSRIKQQEEKYSDGMGQPPARPLTHADSQAILSRLSGAGNGAGGQAGGTAPIVQKSPSTGLYRYSTDGGKTWLAGQPK